MFSPRPATLAAAGWAARWATSWTGWTRAARNSRRRGRRPGAGPRLGRRTHAPDLRAPSRRSEPAVPRDRQLHRLPVHDAGQPRHGAGGPHLEGVLSRERVPAGGLSSRDRRPHPVGPRQARERTDVLQQPGHPARPDRAPGRVDLGRHRVEPGSPGPHGDQLFAGERDRSPERGRLGDAGDRRDRAELPHRVGGAPHAPPGSGPARPGDHHLQPDRSPPSLLLLEQHRLPPARRHPLHLSDVARHRPLRDDLLPLPRRQRGGHDPAPQLSGAPLDLRLPGGPRLLRRLRLGG